MRKASDTFWLVSRDGAVRDCVLREGRALDGEDGVLLEAGFAGSQRIELGKRVRLLTITGFTELPVQGLLEPRGAATFLLLAAGFAGIAYAGVAADEWIIVAAGTALGLWVAGLAVRSLRS